MYLFKYTVILERLGEYSQAKPQRLDTITTTDYYSSKGEKRWRQVNPSSSLAECSSPFLAEDRGMPFTLTTSSFQPDAHWREAAHVTQGHCLMWAQQSPSTSISHRRVYHEIRRGPGHLCPTTNTASGRLQHQLSSLISMWLKMDISCRNHLPNQIHQQNQAAQRAVSGSFRRP